MMVSEFFSELRKSEVRYEYMKGYEGQHCEQINVQKVNVWNAWQCVLMLSNLETQELKNGVQLSHYPKC